LFDTTNTQNDTFTKCLLTTNFKQNDNDLSYIPDVIPNQGTNFGIIGWLRSKYYIYQYPNLNIQSSPSSYLIVQQDTQILLLHSSVVGFRFIVIGGGGAGQNAGGNNGAQLYGVGGSGGGCVIGYYNFLSDDSKTLQIKVGKGGTAGSSGQYSPSTYPYFGNPEASQGSNQGEKGSNSNLTISGSNHYITAGGGPGGTSTNQIGPPYQAGSECVISLGSSSSYYNQYNSPTGTSSQIGSNSGFTHFYDSHPYSNLLQLIQPNVYQVTTSSQLIFPYHSNSTEQLALSYMYGNGYFVNTDHINVYSNIVTNVGSGGYGGCRHNKQNPTIGYYGNNNGSDSSGAGPGSAGAPGLVLIVPQFTTIISL
jgi:hypothetical protein